MRPPSPIPIRSAKDKYVNAKSFAKWTVALLPWPVFECATISVPSGHRLTGSSQMLIVVTNGIENLINSNLVLLVPTQ